MGRDVRFGRVWNFERCGSVSSVKCRKKLASLTGVRAVESGLGGKSLPNFLGVKSNCVGWSVDLGMAGFSVGWSVDLGMAGFSVGWSVDLRMAGVSVGWSVYLGMAGVSVGCGLRMGGPVWGRGGG